MFIDIKHTDPNTPPRCEAEWFAEATDIHYAQCWEDADVLLAGLDIQPGDTCLAIASAGDNALAMLTKNPERVIAIDLNPAQGACLALRVAAYRVLEHSELLELLGSRPSTRRVALYSRCRGQLTPDHRRFWDAHLPAVEQGIGGDGKFERYLAMFRNMVLPMVHRRRRVRQLLKPKTQAERSQFYDRHWDTLRWRLLFRLFFSRFMMGRLGRDPSCFRYVEGHVADRILPRVRHGLTILDPSANPYLAWILTGCHTTTLPFALRAENFDAIRSNLERLEWCCQGLGDFLAACPDGSIDRFNLSDVFEYVSEETYHHLLERLVAAGRPGGRLAYWNMLTPRRRPAYLAVRLRSLSDLSRALHQTDQAFFYSAFVVEEIC